MELKTLTWSDFDQYKPCYSPAERYGEWSGTILDLLQREDIPDDDRIWVATRPGILDDKTLRVFACRCVRQVWHLLTDERSRKAVEVAERYAVGEATQEELVAESYAASAAARAAARAAAMVAESYAASAAAMVTASYAASAAAMVAASAAASYAAGAAGAASRAASRERQIEILIELIQH